MKKVISNQSARNLTNLIFGILVYATSTVLIPAYFILPVVILFVIANLLIGNPFYINGIDRLFIYGLFPVFIIYLIKYWIGFDIVNLGTHEGLSNAIYNSIPAYTFLLVLIFASKYVNKSFFKVLLALIVIEGIICIIEKYLGVTTLFQSHFRYREYNEVGQLYFQRVIGISESPSFIGMKLLIGLIIINYGIIKFSQVKSIILNLLIITASIFVFSRASLLGIVVVYLTMLIPKHLYLPLFYSSVIAFVGFLFFTQFQFDDSELLNPSNRNYLWNEILTFISENLLLGNGGLNYSYEWEGKGDYHAHNYILQALSNFGLIVGSIILTLLFYIVIKVNTVYVIPLLIYSLFNLGMLWGASFIDMIFFSLLNFAYYKNSTDFYR